MMKKYYPFVLFGIFIAIWLWSGWHPVDRTNWLTENQLVFLFIPLLAWLAHYRFRVLSLLSFTCILAFVSLHVIGAHYGYGSVPIGDTVGQMLGMYSNHYDRFVHFCSGALLIYPIYELVVRYAKTKRITTYIIAFSVSLSLSALYEILEWATVMNLDPRTGYLFIGGNDLFDAPKDMAMASIGTILVLGIIAIVYNYKKRTKKN